MQAWQGTLKTTIHFPTEQEWCMGAWGVWAPFGYLGSLHAVRGITLPPSPRARISRGIAKSAGFVPLAEAWQAGCVGDQSAIEQIQQPDPCRRFGRFGAPWPVASRKRRTKTVVQFEVCREALIRLFYFRYQPSSLVRAPKQQAAGFLASPALSATPLLFLLVLDYQTTYTEMRKICAGRLGLCVSASFAPWPMARGSWPPRSRTRAW